jgi:protein TonB
VPAPVPTPAPRRPRPPTPAPTPKPTPHQAAPKPAKPEPDFFASLEKTLAKTPKATGKPVANAAKGPTRPETATQARPGAGAMTGLQAAAINGMKDEIQRRWNPNCEVEGGGAVQVKVSFKLATGGRIVGQVTPATPSARPIRWSRPPPTGPSARSTSRRPSRACRRTIMASNSI